MKQKKFVPAEDAEEEAFFTRANSHEKFYGPSIEQKEIDAKIQDCAQRENGSGFVSIITIPMKNFK